MRVGVSCAVAVVIVLGTLPLVPLLYPDGSLVSASPILNPDKRLTVEGVRSVTGYEVWREVVVSSTGILTVKDGGKLVTDRMILEGNSWFGMVGGVLELSPTAHRRSATISGLCSLFTITDNSVVRIRGPDGGYDIPTSMGCSVGINITVGRSIEVSTSILDIRAGDGFSPPEPLTDDDLDERAFAGGDVELSMVQSSPHVPLWITDCEILLQAGDGGKAPDAEAPRPGPDGRLKGLGGGYTRGGDVRDHVGAGGSVNILLDGALVEVSNTILNVTGGHGGDAGDGANVSIGAQAGGGGGGGYTGGDGASGLNEVKGAMPGGVVSGDVGRGGDIDVSIKAASVDLRTARFDLQAGDGGMAGAGGGSIGTGGGGGGGYSGGGGGSYWHMAGAPGGYVTGDVGRGGHVTVEVIGRDDMEIKSTRFWLLGGRGGDGGVGGDGGAFAGGGGGGFSGGGGGGGGETNGDGAGNDGGEGGRVLGRIGLGGSASLSILTDRLICISSWFDVAGGMGGLSGICGMTHILPSGSVAGGSGGGGHSAGGGGGAGQGDQADGAGGEAGEVDGEVGDGGDGSFVIECERPSLHRNTLVYTKWGSRGSVIPSPVGDTRGEGNARDTYEGTVHEHIPMSEPMLWAPANEEYIAYPPRFDWMPVYRSTTHGDVDHYLFKLDDNNLFENPVVTTALNQPGWFDPDLPMGTYYWNVTAVYFGPPRTEGPVQGFNWFRYFNAPPVVMKEPTIEVDEGIARSVYIGNYVYDSDTGLQDLCLTCEHHGVDNIMGLFLTLRYEEYEPPHQIVYHVSDGTSNISGVLNIVVIDANEWPVIHDVGGYTSNEFIDMEEETERFLEVHASDPNNDPLTYKVVGSWNGANMSKLGTLRLTAKREDIGIRIISVMVEDGMGGVDTMRLRINVSNAKEPPGPPEIFGPKNNSRWKEGDVITFTVKVSDPDIVHGETLTVNWTSDVYGLIGSRTTRDLATLNTNALPAGDHRITVVVSDGKFSTEDEFVIMVVERDDPGPPPDTSNVWLYILFAIICFMMIAVGYYAGTRGARDEMAK